MTVRHPSKHRFSLYKATISMLCTSLILASTAIAAPQGKKAKGPKPVGAVNSSNGGVYNPGEYGVIL